jgi:hypothetical protein
MDNNALEIIFYSILVIGVIVVLFLLLREVICWYYKINERISLQIKTNELLETLIKSSSSSTSSQTRTFNQSSTSNPPSTILNNQSSTSNPPSTILNNQSSINSSRPIGNPFSYGGFEIAQYNFENKMNWDDAKNACEKLGDGWRLPTISELKKLYESEIIMKSMDNGYYWSSNEEGKDNAFLFFKTNGDQYSYTKSLNYHVRAVRIRSF